MRQRQIRKVYRALVGRDTAGGGDLPDQFTITQPIGKLPHPVLGYVYGANDQGQAAYSECLALQRRADSTLLEVTILTGRPHQIRIHLAAYGYPLLGDPLYAVGGVPILSESVRFCASTNKSGTSKSSHDNSSHANHANHHHADHHKSAKLPVPMPVPGDCGYHLRAYALSFQHPCTEQPLSFICSAPPILQSD
jgi:23S rRNA pseudouridine1911/1915/1917 synthase